MKWLVLIGLVSAFTVQAQQPPPASAEFQASSRAAGTTTPSASSSPAPPSTSRPLRIFKKSGLLVELTRSANPSGTANVRVPYRFGAENENLSIDPKTERVRGWILFAIKF